MSDAPHDAETCKYCADLGSLKTDCPRLNSGQWQFSGLKRGQGGATP